MPAASRLRSTLSNATPSCSIGSSGTQPVGRHADLSGDHELPLGAADLDLVGVGRERRVHGGGIATCLHRATVASAGRVDSRDVPSRWQDRSHHGRRVRHRRRQRHALRPRRARTSSSAGSRAIRTRSSRSPRRSLRPGGSALTVPVDVRSTERGPATARPPRTSASAASTSCSRTPRSPGSCRARSSTTSAGARSSTSTWPASSAASARRSRTSGRAAAAACSPRARSPEPTVGWAEHTHYATGKAGIKGMVRSLALELGPDGITVNAIAPGVIATPQALDPVNSLGPEGVAEFGRTSRSAAAAARRTSRPPTSSSPATRRATSPARRSSSTAASRSFS